LLFCTWIEFELANVVWNSVCDPQLNNFYFYYFYFFDRILSIIIIIKNRKIKNTFDCLVYIRWVPEITETI
jgi:hypothetical protein